MSSDNETEVDAGAPFALTEADRASPTWSKLRKHMDARLQSLRAQNDSNLDPEKTARLRGEIKAFKNLLALDKPAPTMVANEEQG